MTSLAVMCIATTLSRGGAVFRGSTFLSGFLVPLFFKEWGVVYDGVVWISTLQERGGHCGPPPLHHSALANVPPPFCHVLQVPSCFYLFIDSLE